MTERPKHVIKKSTEGVKVPWGDKGQRRSQVIKSRRSN